jgi:hypothetical protein
MCLFMTYSTSFCLCDILMDTWNLCMLYVFYVYMYVVGAIWVVHDFKQDCFLQVCKQYVTPLYLLNVYNSAFSFYNRYLLILL